MVGNDVVDLADADSRPGARHPRFDERAFAACERRWIAEAEAEEVARWILWAAKESAYKVAKRRDPATVFSPARFVVELDEALRGRVRHRGDAYPVRVVVRGDCIHAVAIAPGGSHADVIADVRGLSRAGDGDRSGATASLEARTFAIDAVAAQLGVAADSLIIASRERIPRLRRRDGREAADLSLSHHGRFIAYACALLRRPGLCPIRKREARAARQRRAKRGGPGFARAGTTRPAGALPRPGPQD